MKHKKILSNQKLEYQLLEHKIKFINLEIGYRKLQQWILLDLQRRLKKLKEKDNQYFGVKQKKSNLQKKIKIHQRKLLKKNQLQKLMML